MEPLTLNEVAQGCAGRLVRGGAETRVDRVTTDSRRTQVGDLFVALRGDRFDGHAFVGEAARDGAVADVEVAKARIDAALADLEAAKVAIAVAGRQLAARRGEVRRGPADPGGLRCSLGAALRFFLRRHAAGPVQQH